MNILFFNIDTILTILSGVTSLTIGILLLIRYLDIKDRIIILFSISFSLMGLGIILEPASTYPISLIYWRMMAKHTLPHLPHLFIYLWISSLILQIAGFIGIIATYYISLTPKKLENSIMSMGIIQIGIIGITPYLLLIILASYASSITLSKYIIQRSRGNLITFIGFLSLMISYTLIIFSILNPLLSIAGEIFRLTGYSLMLFIFLTPPEET